jgi:hypothetical protein
LVTITAPEGIVTSVLVQGPGEYQQTLTVSGTLGGLAAGSYTVTGMPDTGSSSIVPVTYSATISGSPATVSAGDTALANVSYAAQPGTGMLWMSNAGTETGLHQELAQAYTAAQLEPNTFPPPAPVSLVSSQATALANGAAFDREGNLWVADSLHNTVSKFAAAPTRVGPHS